MVEALQKTFLIAYLLKLKHFGAKTTFEPFLSISNKNKYFYPQSRAADCSKMVKKNDL